ncbi:D-glycero-beta-D-manno-heptose 1,7-bisphosphate 7-phosphatase [Sphingomonas sp. PB4P5]|uniref:D-glycero-beta-D-manno-heptose 1,7-bisphosphate 7-phosphatase n=1 Tax=Parasphingomonas puruogangriensis TaxID=3096155 RepID=UPI002FC62785
MTIRRCAIFLDRDGVINVDHHYVFLPSKFEVISGVFDALHRARSLGYALIVVTNQSGIARGYFSPLQYLELEAHMRRVFAAQGLFFDGIYHCPHHPAGSVAQFAIACSCRKPQPGMILQAAREHDLDLAGSVMVGDKDSDIAAARAAGVGRSYLLDPPRLTLRDVVLDLSRLEPS